MSLLAAAAATAGIFMQPAGSSNVSDPCTIDQVSSSSGSSTSRLVTTRDLATMADIGRSDPYASPTPLGVSPDGSMVAFVVRRANPDANAYCQQLVIMPSAGGKPREIDRGGEFMRATMSLWRLAALKAGFAAVVAPRWSPDGRTVAYLKRTADSTQVWTVSASGGPATMATHFSSDIDDFAWARNGRALIVAHRPALDEARAEIALEGRTGWLFDERFSPMQQDRPFPLEPIATVYDRVDLETGSVAAATPEEVALVDPSQLADRPKAAGQFASDEVGDRAWTAKSHPELQQSASMLVLEDKSGNRRSCTISVCAHVMGLWWAPNRREAWFQVREGWGSSFSAVYRWKLTEKHPNLVFRTVDALVGCTPAAKGLLCAREGATSPRKIIMIDMRDGHQLTIYDPNPLFKSLRLGEDRRFTFLNAYGVECYADLILPPDHKPGQKHPLVLVQYIDDGFLRGGTGDEVPIQALAARGFAVLSFARPMFVPATRAAKSDVEQRQLNRVGWVDRRSVESALEIAVSKAIATGTVDADRMGISGLSDGASTTQWALINTNLFSVAALGSCCEDRVALPLNGGPGYEQFLREMNYPAFDSDERSFWAPLSLVQNADRISAPILIQTADTEYEMGLDVIAALRARGKPLEVRVFPDEVHFKWQPAHRLAMYDRVVAWFRFWLMHEMECGPTHDADNARWLAMMPAASRSQVRCVAPRLP